MATVVTRPVHTCLTPVACNVCGSAGHDLRPSTYITDNPCPDCHICRSELHPFTLVPLFIFLKASFFYPVFTSNPPIIGSQSATCQVRASVFIGEFRRRPANAKPRFAIWACLIAGCCRLLWNALKNRIAQPESRRTAGKK